VLELDARHRAQSKKRFSPITARARAAIASAANRRRMLAHCSLIFDELFFLQLGLGLRRSVAVQEPGTAFPPSTRLVPALRARLPAQFISRLGRDDHLV